MPPGPGNPGRPVDCVAPSGVCRQEGRGGKRGSTAYTPSLDILLFPIKIWVLVEESSNWDYFKKPLNKSGMPTFMGGYLPVFQIFPLGGHQVVENYGVGSHCLFLCHFFEVLQGFIGDVFPLFEGD